MPLPDYATDILLQHFHEFALIGGMPEVVDAYTNSKDLNRINDIFESLLISYKDDVVKYAKNQTEIDIIRHII